MLGMGQSLPVAVVITFLLAITLQAIFVAYLFAMTLPYYSIRYAQFTAACAWIVAWAATCKLVNAFTSGFVSRCASAMELAHRSLGPLGPVPTRGHSSLSWLGYP